MNVGNMWRLGAGRETVGGRSVVATVAIGILWAGLTASAQGGPVTAPAREAAEWVLKKFGKEAAEEGVETLAKKIEQAAVQHGDDVLAAVRKVGPKGLSAIEKAGAHAPEAAALLARHGDDALWLASKSENLSLFAKYGDDAAEALIRHGDVAVPLVSRFASPAASALKGLGTQNGRRLAMMEQAGELAKIGRTSELLGVISKYGDKAMEFIWKNKGALTVTAALTAFLVSPGEFLDGTKDLAEVVGRGAGTAFATAAERAASSPAIVDAISRLWWKILLAAAAILGIGFFMLRAYVRFWFGPLLR